MPGTVSGGYNAGSVFVDVEINVKVSKELDELKEKLNDVKKIMTEFTKEVNNVNKALKSNTKQVDEYDKSAKKVSNSFQSLASRSRNVKKELSKINDEIEKQVKTMNEAAESNERYAKSLYTSLNTIKAIILSAGAKNLAEALIIPNAELESSIASFEVLLGSYEKAQKLTSSLEDLAIETPLTSTDLRDVAKQLLAVGTPLEEMVDTIRMLGDLSLGNADRLEQIVNAYGKIVSSGKGSLEYLNYFAESGVPIFEALSEQLGVTKEEFFQLTDAGKVMSEDVVNALKKMTSEGGRFYNMMEKQSKTASGLYSTLSDELTIISRDIGSEAFEQLKGYIEEILNTIDELRESGKLDEITGDLGKGIGNIVTFIGNAIKVLYEFRDVIGIIIEAVIGNKIAKGVIDIGKSFTNLKTSVTKLNPELIAFNATITLISMGILALIGKINDMVEEINEAVEEYRDLNNEVKEYSETLNKEEQDVAKNISKTNELIDIIRKLSSQENISVEQKNELINAINELNSMYSDLNLSYDEENNKLNRNIGSVEDYIDSLIRLNDIQRKTSLVSEIDEQIENMDEAIKNGSDELLNLIHEFGLKEIKSLDELKKYIESGYDFKVEDNGFFGNISSLFKTTGESAKIVAFLNELNTLENQRNSLLEKRESLYNELVNSGYSQKEAQEAVNEAFEDILTPVEKASEAIDKYNLSMENLQTNADSLISELSTLTSIMSKEGNSIILTREETDKLLSMYPELVNSIKKTSNGYEVERQAILLLTQAKLLEQKEAADAEAEKSWQVARETANRIGIYGTEIDALNSITEAQVLLSRLSSSEAHKAFSEVLEYAIKAQQVADATSARIQMLIDEFKTPVKVSTKTSTVNQESEDERLIRNLKFRLDMEQISYEEYYNELEKIRDKYYKNGTREWQEYTLEITKGRKQLVEDAKQAALEAYEDRLSNSYNWLEDEQFYGRINDEEIIAGYKRIKEYTKQYYKDGVIDYERYADEIRKIDKEIYSIQKENLETSMDELSDYRKKKYDEAVAQVEAYYDELEKAEEEYERKQEMKDLIDEAKLYEAAVTKTGKQRYQDLQDEIKELMNEQEKIDRETEKENKLKELEDAYNNLESVQLEYFDTILTYSDEVTRKIQEMTSLIDNSFGNISSVLGNTVNNNNVINNNKTLIQNNTINDKATGQAVIDLTAVKYRYSL